jgi:hypothetical protein
LFSSIFNTPCMRLKIWCDGKSEKFCKIFWELNKALFEICMHLMVNNPIQSFQKIKKCGIKYSCGRGSYWQRSKLPMGIWFFFFVDIYCAKPRLIETLHKLFLVYASCLVIQYVVIFSIYSKPHHKYMSVGCAYLNVTHSFLHILTWHFMCDALFQCRLWTYQEVSVRLYISSTIWPTCFMSIWS